MTYGLVVVRVARTRVALVKRLIMRTPVGSTVVNVIEALQPPPVAVSVVLPPAGGAVKVTVEPEVDESWPSPSFVQSAPPSEYVARTRSPTPMRVRARSGGSSITVSEVTVALWQTQGVTASGPQARRAVVAR